METLEARQLLSASAHGLKAAAAAPTGSIGIQFVGGGSPMQPTQVAGVMPQGNYNVEFGGTGSGALVDSTGATTNAMINYAGGGGYQVPNNAIPATDDQTLNSGFVFGATTTTVSNIPFPEYDVYVYELNDAAGREETTSLGGRTFYGTSADPSDANHVSGVPNTYQYTQSTSTDPANPTANGDYVLFDKVTGSSFTLTNSAPGNGYLNGIQIVPDTGAPDAVPTLTANGNQLNFGSTPGATSYNILRSTSSGQESVIKTGVTGTSYIDATAVGGTQYFYTVEGVNQYGTGPASPEVQTTAPQSPPSAPASLNATGGPSGTVLTWPGSTGASSYNVLRGSTPGSETLLASNVSGTSYTDNTSVTGKPFYYTVEAVNTAGTSGPSPEASAASQPGLGIQFVGNGTALTPTQTAGVVAQDNYNLATTGMGTSIPLNDGTGKATNATLTFTGGGPYQVPNSGVAATGDQALNSGFVFGDTTTTIANVPYAQYDVYVYELNDAAGRTETTTVDGNSFYGNSANPSDANHVSGLPNTYQYTQSSSHDVNNPTPNGDYVLFSKVSDPTLTIMNTAPGNGYINGVQIVQDLGAPDAPATLTGTLVPGGIQLNFPVAGGATTYNILRSTASGQETILKSGVTGNTYTDTTTVPGTTYYYTVQGVSQYGTGPASPEAQVTVPTAPPAAPTGLFAIGGQAGIALLWNGSSTATSYNVLRGTTPGGETVLQTGVTGTDFTDTTAMSGTTYYYTVQGVNAAGAGASSNETSGTETNSIGIQYAGGGTALTSGQVAGFVPQANYNVTAVATGTGTAVPLNDSSGAATTATVTFNGGGPYQVPNSATAATPDQVLNSGFVFGNTTTTVSNIPYSVYDVVVYELNDSAGREEITTLGNQTYYGTSANPSDANHVSGVANTYQYTQSTSTDAANPTPSGDFVLFQKVTGSSFTLTNFAPGNGYINGLQIIPIQSVPDRVPSLTAAGIPGGIQLTYGAAPGAITYNILRSTTSGQEAVIQSGVTGTTFTDTTAVPGTTYYYTVQGVNPNGTGPASPEASAKVFTTAPAAPATLTASGNPSSIQLTFSPSSGATSYNVLRGTAPGQETLLQSGVTGTTFTDTTTTAGTTYYYTVEAVNSLGTSGPSPEASASEVASIGIQFVGGGTALTSNQSAGVVPQANYNTVTGGTGNNIVLNNSNGTATTATLTFAGGGPYQVPNSATAATPDQVLNSGFVFGTTAVTVSNIPYASYDVYVYELNDGAGREETTSIGNQTYYGISADPSDANHVSGMPNTYLYTQSTSTNPNYGTPNGDYVEFTGLSGSSFTLNVSAPGNGYLNGIQIVPVASAVQPVTLSSVAINDGSAAVGTTNQAQRSEVRELVLKFSGPVQLNASNFTLNMLNTGGSGKNDGSAPTALSGVIASATSPDGGTTWVLTFNKSVAGATDATSSLVDGIYTVTVNSPNVTGSNLTTTFHRLFGDINGDKQVTNTDYFQFRKAFNTSTGQAGFNPDFDFSGGGTINNADYFQFRKRFLMAFTY